ncbi:hypothetical protein SODALDRAFT_324818 [Sodiomyces alkalinus F11]|uniref:Uncharacterized protein n=1 Tax=Sodiomyces alkalinus (strain CBS 110278 / VKM F-3762 / F11) TaxID=1314773 RepID=A0A3N2PRQ6_SODAK|nr:hypothetical protein SODALDRAFT_324818 [Sodiomyces alkalinus F11]ROT37168.1 hypothetical protein SODALDRAFT_324818 [Sodiomyces alkalinus F11]
MSALRGAAADLVGLFSRTRGPSYHKLNYEGPDDPESGSPQRSASRRGLLTLWPGRLSPKGLLGIVAATWLILLCIFYGSNLQISQTAPTPSTGTGTGTDVAPDSPPHNAVPGQGNADSENDLALPPTTTTPSTAHAPSASPTSSTSPARTPGHRNLRIILPADDPNPNLCKTIFAAIANGYPAPVIANWGRDFKKTDKTFGGFGGSHLGKLDGTLAALEALSSTTTPPDERLRPDDLVLIMDAYDVWIQLPPSVLIRRWLAQNAAAASRIRAAWPADAQGAASPPLQSVILSTQKKCWPTKADGSDTHCDILPESTARGGLYGPDTDKPDAPLQHRRPRYINSGSMLGPARDAIRILRRAKAKVEASRAAGLNLYSDQGILGEILGEQEVWRKAQRERTAAASEVPEANPGGAETWEYGMGLDYVQDLFVPTVFMEDDGEYLVLANQTAVDEASRAHKVDPPRLSGVPRDVLAYAPSPLILAGVQPETGAEGEAEAGDDQNNNNTNNEWRNATGWADVPLYADYWSTQVPVGVHHNAHRGGMKGRRLREWWSKTWFFPYLRDIVATRSQPRDARKPLVTIPAAEVDESEEGHGHDLVYWAPEADMRKPLPRTFNPDEAEGDGDSDGDGDFLPEAGWDALCQAVGTDEDDWWDVIFQDDKGPLGQEGQGREPGSK